jgi:hypothetical protein
MLLKLPTLDQMTDILDIKPIAKVSLLWYGVAALAVLLVILFLIYWRLRKKEAPVPKPVARKALSPRETALTELDALETLKLVEKGQFRKYYFRLSEILRHFLQDEIRVPAVDATTEEIRPHLKSSKFLAPEEIQLADRILVDMDLVKFAKFVPSPEEIRRLREELRVFIQTAPQKSFQSSNPAASKVLRSTPAIPEVRTALQEKARRG